MIAAFQVHPDDNVATLLADAAGEAVKIIGAAQDTTVVPLAPIALGHKIALRDIAAGEPVIKYGVPIGMAVRDIRRGEWLHLQNCRSLVDERSAGFDVETGAATDTAYE
jgi:altronate dehydratase small subunit